MCAFDVFFCDECLMHADGISNQLIEMYIVVLTEVEVMNAFANVPDFCHVFIPVPNGLL